MRGTCELPPRWRWLLILPVAGLLTGCLAVGSQSRPGELSISGPSVVLRQLGEVEAFGLHRDVRLAVGAGRALDRYIEPELPSPRPAAAAVSAAPLPDTPRVLEYTVQPGDTLWDIAQAHNTDVQTLMYINEVSRDAAIQAGERIKILTVPGLIHAVEPGDTIDGVADSYGIKVTEIVRANGLADPDWLSIGQELIIPGGQPQRSRDVWVAAARSGGPRSNRADPGWIWPAAGPITSGFGPRWGGQHKGLDIGAPQGATIVAGRAGRVSYAGWMDGYGNVVTIDHGGGVKSMYGHASVLLVGQDEWVERGQQVARVGTTGWSTGPHLHFEILIDGTSVNPLGYLP